MPKTNDVMGYIPIPSLSCVFSAALLCWPACAVEEPMSGQDDYSFSVFFSNISGDVSAHHVTDQLF